MKHIPWTKLAAVTCACLVISMAVSAQGNGGPSYSPAQIEQFVAPVALYPDALLAQVFMAATYPGEVVEANGWAQQNPGLSGDSLAAALDGQNWDVSVKSLVPFPEVLNRMAVNVAWTQDLGDAFLVQPDDVMGAVQRLRHRSYDAGYLRTSQYQRVMVEQQYIQIMPVGLQLVYVPAYSPMVVYGPGWGYPTYYYPAMMAPPPYYVSGNVISFGIGFSVGAALFGAFDWNHHDVYYGPNFYQYQGYRRNVVDWRQRYPSERPGGHNIWVHNPVHRGPGGYHNPVLDQRYGHGSPAPSGHNPPPTNHNPPPVVRNPSPATHPQEPRTTHPQPVTHPAKPETHPQEPRTIEPKPVTHPPKPVIHPQEPRATHPQPVTHPPKPVIHPQEPKTTHPQPAAHPQQPAAHPQEPRATRSQEPAKHAQPPAKPPNAQDKKNEEKK